MLRSPLISPMNTMKISIISPSEKNRIYSRVLRTFSFPASSEAIKISFGFTAMFSSNKKTAGNNLGC